jgi:predicted glutamine amidotransferase
MCMLCVVPPNVIPSRSKLENSALNNPHGFGYAIAVPKERRIHTFTTMDADACINKFIEDRSKYLEGYAVWHARYATHGSNTVDNCHPFKVGNDEQTYLAHNGILNVLEEKGEMRSDTRIFAEDIMSTIGGVTALDNPQVWNMLEDFTTGSKIAFLTVNPKANHQLYLLHEEKGNYDVSGVWWSNTTYELETWYQRYGAATYAKHATSSLSKEEDEEGAWLECHVCDNVTDYWVAMKNGNDSYCSTCGTCYMCASYKTECLCYQGTKPPYDNRTGYDIPAWGW